MKKPIIFLLLIIGGLAAFGQTYTPMVNPFTGDLQMINTDAAYDSTYIHARMDSAHSEIDSIASDIAFSEGASVQATEFQELETIGATTLSANQWAILGALVATLTGVEVSYMDGVISAVQTQLEAKLNKADTVDLASVVKILTDTSLYFTVNWGAGNAGDTVGFNLDSIFWDVDWDVSHVLNITKISAKVKGSSPDIDLAFLVNSTPVAAGSTAILSTDMTVTSTATWTDVTSFNDATIGKGESIMVRIDQLTSKPVNLSFNIFGYLTE